jgi:DNA-nicking Smr family endonuclease
MPKKFNIKQEDLDAFHKAMEGTKPLKKDKVSLSPPLRKKRIIPKPKPEPGIQLNEADYLLPVKGEEVISYKHDSLSNKILRNLRKGQYNVDAILDLHGMSVEEAREAVGRFIQTCLHEEVRVALIIHGKGQHDQMPILKNKLNHWLRQINVILAFCSASPTHGSRGAMYVLLKHMVEEN